MRTDRAGNIHFDKLLIATGAKPIRSTIPGSTLAGIHYLSTLADAEALRQAAKDATHGVVLGGSFLGVEIATSLARMGIQVVLIEENELLLSQLTAAELSAFFSRYCAERGIELRTNDTVAAFQGSSRVEAVMTRLGEIRPCDLVVVAIGVTADIEFLRDSGIRLGDGILVNQHLETSVPGIFAAGDVANFFDTVFRERRRIEHWDNAVKRPRPSIEIAMPAAASLPVNTALVNCAPLVGVENIGRAEARQRLVERRETERRVHRIRQPPCQHRPARPVDDRHQIEKAFCHPYVGDIRSPRIVGPIDRQAARQIGIISFCGEALLVPGLGTRASSPIRRISRRTLLRLISRPSARNASTILRDP